MAGSVGQPTQTWFPWAGDFSEVGNWFRNPTTTALGIGEYYNQNAALNDQLVVYAWMDSVVWKSPVIATTHTDSAIVSVLLDGNSVGTVDLYSSTLIRSVYQEVTGVSVSTPGVKVVTYKAASKNASSSAYYMRMCGLALIATSGAYSTPSGSDTPGYTVEWIPWMGYKTAVGSWPINSVNQNSGELGGGVLYQSAIAQNNSVTHDSWIDTGTYKIAVIALTYSSGGIDSITGISGTQTFDTYSAGLTKNVYAEVTGIAVSTAGVKTIQHQAASKNASSSNYDLEIQSVKYIRTGA